MRTARLQFVSLWISQDARVVADWTLRMAAVAQWTALHPHDPPASAWYLATVVFVLPWIVLAPLNGSLCNSLPRRWVLVGSSAFTLAAIFLVTLTNVPWLACLGVVAIGSAVYSATRYAMLPAASTDTGVSLPRLNSWIDLGGAAAILVGMSLGWNLGGSTWWPLFTALLALNLLCLVTALPVAFPADVPRPEAPLAAIRGFFVDLVRISRVGEACAMLLGLAAFQAIVTAGGGVLLAQTLASGFEHSTDLYQTLLLVGGGSALGCAVAGWQKHPARNQGLVAPAAAGLLLGLAWTANVYVPGGVISWMPVFLLGFTGGLINVPLRSAYLAAVPADARGNAMSIMNTAIYLATSSLALLMVALASSGLLTSDRAQLVFLAILAALGLVLASVWLVRATLENLFEIVAWPFYRVSAAGPGAERLPARGALLVIANHASYTDPLYVGKIVPQFIHPMMTSVFYDLPFVRWWLVHVFQVIRVEATLYRREAPELAEAVAFLKQGKCVVIFPEAYLRRTEEQPLRAFGQGVWHILREVPDTPVAVLWIEGGFGSYFSYYNGPPGRNKRFDWWRRIRIGVGEVQPLPAALLVDHRTTRDYLYRACLDCRHYLSLEALPASKARSEEAAGEDAATIKTE